MKTKMKGNLFAAASNQARYLDQGPRILQLVTMTRQLTPTKPKRSLMKLEDGRRAISKLFVRKTRSLTMEHWTRVMYGTNMMLIKCDYVTEFACSAMLSVERTLPEEMESDIVDQFESSGMMDWWYSPPSPSMSKSVICAPMMITFDSKCVQ